MGSNTECYTVYILLQFSNNFVEFYINYNEKEYNYVNYNEKEYN